MNLFEKQAKLNQLFTQSPVATAYLSGSLASRSSFGELTDVDIAILLTEQIKSDQFLDYQLFFFSELAKRLESDSIDIVILNQASLLIKLQVIKYGQILFSRDEKSRIAFETKAVMDYLDFKKMDEIQKEALSRRLVTPTAPIRDSLIEQPLLRLHESIRVLKDFQSTSIEDFKNNIHHHAAAERYLQIAIEGFLQICNQIVASMGLRRPEGYQDLLSVVTSQNIIPANLSYRLEILSNLRDELVHGTSEVNAEMLYDYLQNRVKDLEEFASHIEMLLGNKE